jgi:hypothetical protein
MRVSPTPRINTLGKTTTYKARSMSAAMQVRGGDRAELKPKPPDTKSSRDGFSCLKRAMTVITGMKGTMNPTSPKAKWMNFICFFVSRILRSKGNQIFQKRVMVTMSHHRGTEMSPYTCTIPKKGKFRYIHCMGLD